MTRAAAACLGDAPGGPSGRSLHDGPGTPEAVRAPREAPGSPGRPAQGDPGPGASRRAVAAGGAVRVASLASGSRGNALLVEVGGDRLLIDCGLTPHELARRLAALGRAPRDLTALVLTHEHVDHARGAAGLALVLDLPVYGTAGTLRALVARAGRPGPAGAGSAGDGAGCGGAWAWRPRDGGRRERQRVARLARPLAAGEPVRVGAVTLRPVALPHDAAEPVAYVLEAAGVRIGIATDLGRPAAAVAAALTDCDLLVLEFNHDAGLLREGPYHPTVKRRVAGGRGHLSNDEAASLLAAVAHSGLKAVWLAHLSRINNSPERALAAARAALRSRIPFAPVGLACLPQDEPGGMIALAGRP